MGEIKKSIETTCKEFNKHLKSLMGLQKKITDSEYVTLFSDTSKVYKLFREGSKLISQKKFEYFLKGFNPNDKPTDEQIDKLKKYINNEEKAEFISDAFSKIILANSSRSCLVMGSIIKQMMDLQKSGIDHNTLIVMNALTNFFNNDIDNFLTLCNVTNSNLSSNISRTRSTIIRLNNLGKSLNKDAYRSVIMTLEKCINLQIIRRDYDIDLNMDSDDVEFSDADIDESYILNSAGKLLEKYIKQCL